MDILKFFAKIIRPEKPKKSVQGIADPLEPLDLHPYNQHNKGGRPQALTDAHVIQIMRWKTEKISNREIGRRLHVSETTIRRSIISYTRTASPTSNPETMEAGSGETTKPARSKTQAAHTDNSM